MVKLLGLRPSAESSARRRQLSTGALVATAALGPFLLGSAIYSRHAVEVAAEALLAGEGQGWVRALGGRLRGAKDNNAIQAAFDAFLAESQAEGLRYAAYVGRERRFEAGSADGPIDATSLREGAVSWAGKRVQFAMVSPPLSGGRPPSRGWGPHLEPRRPPRSPALLVVEFEPRAHAGLVTSSHRTLALGGLTAATVMLLSAWVFVSTRRRHHLEREAERAQHLAALGAMSAVLAHEIRNPLASLKGHAQLLVEALEAQGLDRPRSKAARVVDEAVRIERITTDLLDFVREGELARAPTDLNGLVRLSVEEVIPPERLRLTLPDTPLVMAVDSSRLRQAIDNVARNAAQAGDGPVEITLSADADAVTLTVRDHGPGIPPGQEERIFEPFITTRTRGTGLGLPIARRIVDRHGGTLRGRNHADGGAVFQLTLPGPHESTD